MKKRVVSVLLTVAMGMSALAGCGNGGKQDGAASAGTEQNKESAAVKEASEEAAGTDKTASGGEVLEFYHGYYHAESEWPAAKVMRDIYDEFAAEHADGPVSFKPIAVENRDEIVSAQVAGGNFPDMVDCGAPVPQAAISQGLVLDLKPFIDENQLQDAVGLNYTQNDVDGHIYTVHDQVESRGIWYNSDLLNKAGVTEKDLQDWDSFGKAMEKVRQSGSGAYGYAAGQGSLFIVVSAMAATEEGREMMESELTPEIIDSECFAEAFKLAAALDQENGSEHTTEDVGNLMDDFNKNGMAAVLFNGVWNASGIDESLADVIEPAVFPGNIAVASAGAGLTVSSGMSQEKTDLALEFIRYMTSSEVQEKIFTGVQANPCNQTVDLNKLAEESGNPITLKLAKACSLVNESDIIVKGLYDSWGADVAGAMINALMECAVSGTDIDARFEQLQKELIALIG